MSYPLLVGGVVIAVGPLRRSVLRPAAKLAVKASLTVADAAAGAVRELGDVCSEAKERSRGARSGSAATPDLAPVA